MIPKSPTRKIKPFDLKQSNSDLSNNSFYDYQSTIKQENDQINDELQSVRSDIPVRQINLSSVSVSSFEGQRRSVSRSQNKIKRIKKKEEEEINLVQKIKNISGNLYKSIKTTFNFNKQKCQCDNDLDQNQTCSVALRWLLTKYNINDLKYLKETYEKLQLVEIDQIIQNQVKKDINRTCQNKTYFKENNQGWIILKNILQTIAIYDPQVGYVQGMNQIASLFVFHAEEYIAFWLLVMIFENFEMRDIYMPNLPGLAKHSMIVDILIRQNLPGLYQHFCEKKVKVEMYFTPWLFSLFSVLIPLECMDKFMNQLIDEGWVFFYKMVISFLDQREELLMKMDDMCDILMTLVEKNPHSNQEEQEKCFKLIENAISIQIDKFSIQNMIQNYDPVNQRFKITQSQLKQSQQQQIRESYKNKN